MPRLSPHNIMDYINKVDEFISWIEKYPAQITVLSSQVLWSASIECALTGKKTLHSLSKIKQQYILILLFYLTNFVYSF